MTKEVAAKEHFGALATDDRQLDCVSFIADANEILGPRFRFLFPIAPDLHNALGHECYLARHTRRYDRHVGTGVNQRGYVTYVPGRRCEIGDSDPNDGRGRVVATVVLHVARRQTRGDGTRLTRARRSTRPIKRGTSPYFAVTFLNRVSSSESMPTIC